MNPLCNSIYPLPLPGRLLYITVTRHVDGSDRQTDRQTDRLLTQSNAYEPTVQYAKVGSNIQEVQNIDLYEALNKYIFSYYMVQHGDPYGK